MRVRVTTEPDGDLCMESAYAADFVADFKAAIPSHGRQWHPDRKRWRISALYTVELLAFLASHQVQDDRTPTGVPENSPRPPMPEDLRAAFDTLHCAYTAPLGAAEAVYKFLVRHSTHEDVQDGHIDFHGLSAAITTVRRYLNPPRDSEEHDDDTLPF